MKVGIIGSGFVGSTAAYAMVMRGIGREIVLVDLDKKRSSAEADDISHAVPFSHPLQIYAGEYADLKDASVILITAGVGQRPGETRMELLNRNARVFQSVIPQALSAAPNAILLVASNPVDVMTHITAKIAAKFGVPSHRVLGTGTTLDTARFRALLAKQLGVDATHVHAYVLGEHGDSEVLTWSLVTVGVLPLDDYCKLNNLSLCAEEKASINDQVRRAAYKIIEGKGATYYGVGSAIARIIEVLLHDQRSILTVCTPMEQLDDDILDVTISLPRIVGGNGVLTTLFPPINQEERAALKASAQLIRNAISEIRLEDER